VIESVLFLCFLLSFYCILLIQRLHVSVPLLHPLINYHPPLTTHLHCSTQSLNNIRHLVIFLCYCPEPTKSCYRLTAFKLLTLHYRLQSTLVQSNIPLLLHVHYRIHLSFTLLVSFGSSSLRIICSTRTLYAISISFRFLPTIPFLTHIFKSCQVLRIGLLYHFAKFRTCPTCTLELPSSL
jgi:hypothetical protein